VTQSETLDISDLNPEFAQPADYSLGLRYSNVAPLVNGEMAIDPELTAPSGNELFLVQFWTLPQPEYREQIEALGGLIYRFVPPQSFIVRMSADEAQQVEQLPFVRWMDEFHTAYKLDESIISAHSQGLAFVENAKEGLGEFATQNEYSIEVFERAGNAPVVAPPAERNDDGTISPAPRTHTLRASGGLGQQELVKEAIEAMGGSVRVTSPGGFRMHAHLTMDQVLKVARMNEVHFIEPWGFGGPDMNIVRDIGGADHIESTLGFTGEGVRAEVFDTEVRVTHTEFTSLVPILHSDNAGEVWAQRHGTSVYSHMFARGADADARGLLPDADAGYFYDYSECTQWGGSDTRLQIANELKGFNVVLQTSSVGTAQTKSYTTISEEMDDMLFQTGLLHMQSQSNEATASNGSSAQMSRPHAWAKNIVSVGAVCHYDTATRDDDTWVDKVWGDGASVGPAADGRIKPDLSFFYDYTWAAKDGSDTAYREFGGTSGATPSVSGYMGIFHQMWHENIWDGTGELTSGVGTVYSNRPKPMLAKAALINTAFRYEWTPGSARNATGSIDRYVQGWGMPDMENLYDLRDKTFFVNESCVLAQGQSKTHLIRVENDEPWLNVTMSYLDPAGTTSALQHRINDLSLKVISPSGTVYWGNNGLLDDNTSTSGGSANTKDTVENVFIPNPATGRWTVEIHATTVVQDSHLETSATDADYALWVTGGVESGSLKTTYRDGNQNDGAMFDITAERNIKITGFDIHHSSSSAVTVEVYTTPGGYSGKEGNAGEWTLLGTDTITPNRTGAATFIDVGGLQVKAGQTYGIYITDTGAASGSLLYTNGSEIFDNDEIRINTGAGVAYPFGTAFSPRSFNGSVYYDVLPPDETGPFAFSIQSNGDDRLYRINLHTGFATPLGDPMGFGDAEGLAYGPGDTLYAVGGYIDQLWNVTSPPGALIGSTGSRDGADAGLDYYNGHLYNVNSTGPASTLYRINPDTGVANHVGTGNYFLDGLAIRSDGVTFATDFIHTDSLYQINLNTGSAALVGSLGIGDVNDMSGLAFIGSTLYAITSAGHLYTIDTTTGGATFVADITIDGFAPAGGWEGLAIPPGLAAAPMKLQDFEETYSHTTQTRGYWFTAPTDFIINGLRVPDEARAGIQNVEVVRFESPPPVAGSSVASALDVTGSPEPPNLGTNNFDSLFRRVGVESNSIIPTAIPVREGDVIGIIGAAGNTFMRNSYAASNEYNTKIFDHKIKIKRMGMQHNLYKTPARELWTVSNANPFARIELYYGKTADIFLDADTPATGSTLDTTPLSTEFGTISATGTVEIRSHTIDPDLYRGGSSGSVFDIVNSPTSASELFFNFNVESITFLYGGHIGVMNVEARDKNGTVVDSFYQSTTDAGQPVGPQTLAGKGIRSLYWTDPGWNHSSMDNLYILKQQTPFVISPFLLLLLDD
ncbi:MAG: hypothetical protein D3926_04570, partial [Desulfobacteraceae bacterium]